ncbi:unnamed protein product [Linum tenue]|uniref:RING-type E3 ubiquitin transferase n=1 Tax=Linum tenue TaxID=586396 RepID=A0AAV0QV64_9ROSI|nr:unnamed protein product [Linum tenue]
MSDLLSSISYDSSNLLLAAFISLLLVILFVLLLHIYAKWYLSRRMRTTTVITSLTLQPPSVINYRYHFQTHPPLPTADHEEGDQASGGGGGGLNPSVIAAIPLFVYINSRSRRSSSSSGGWIEEQQGSKSGVVVNVKYQHQCVICLSSFGDGEVGRCLTGCGHGFHVDCIDMWLLSHSNCPICRAPAAPLPPAAAAAAADSADGVAPSKAEDDGAEVCVLISGSGESSVADDRV